jgi:hypothetical protein
MADLLLEAVHPVSEPGRGAGAPERPPTGIARPALYVVEGTEGGQKAWFVVRVRPERAAALLKVREQPHLNVPDYGDILASGWADRDAPEAGVAYALQKALPDLDPELVLARAARIAAGDTKPSDYLSLAVVERFGRGADATVAEEVRATVRAIERELDARYPMSALDELRLTTDFLLRRFYPPDHVLCRRTEAGALVLAVGFDQIGPVFRHLKEGPLRGYVVECLNDPTF